MGRFEMYNANPKNKKTEDCVIRAISVALDKPWEDVYMDLAKLGIKKGLILNTKNCYKAYLKSLGIQMEKMPKTINNKRLTVNDFMCEIAKPGKTYIVEVAGHLTVVKNRVTLDTWDCTRKYVYNYFEVNK